MHVSKSLHLDCAKLPSTPPTEAREQLQAWMMGPGRTWAGSQLGQRGKQEYEISKKKHKNKNKQEMNPPWVVN